MSGGMGAPPVASARDLLRQVEAALPAASPAELPEILGTVERIKARAYERLIVRSSEDRFLSLPEVARRLGLRVERVREMSRRGELPTVVMGGRRKVRASRLEEHLRQREESR